LISTIGDDWLRAGQELPVQSIQINPQPSESDLLSGKP